MECAEKQDNPAMDQITDPNQIDLTRHAMIEASAGTGKTYTIENLVVRLITEQPDLAVENILLVTFTEKAAGELKVRIREKIAQHFQAGVMSDAPEHQRLKTALDNFDQASVFTIHGFCQNVLSELAYENNALFDNELKEDQAIYDSLLRDRIRRVWPARYGAALSELLRLCGFAEKKEQLLERIIRIAAGFSPAAGDRLMPRASHDDYAQFKAELTAGVDRLKALLIGPPLFSETFSKLNIHGGTSKALLRNIIDPLESFFRKDPLGAEWDLCKLSAHFETIRTKTKGFGALVPEKWGKKGPNPEVCPDLDRVVAAALELDRNLLVAAHWIACDAICDLKAAVSQKKEQNGWISFDDMLVRVHQALFSERAPLLLKRLREKYKIAFVDEFQDTDPIQWRIFRRIFIDTGGSEGINPLILIGDPKQAIYSFRGADVYAYLEARNTLSELSSKGGAHLYSLCHNWRSLPELVANFNQLFSQAHWFSPSASDQFSICYTEAFSPAREQLPLRIIQDHTGRPSLNIVNLQSRSSARQARKVLANFIASEINRLVGDGSLLLGQKEGNQRALDYGDISILVRGKSEVSQIETALQAAEIPYSFYKKPGLFQSEQAEELSLVLHAIMDPGDGEKVKKALLTPFFAAQPQFLYAYSNLPVTHPVRQLLLAWNELALKRQWRPLFQALMESSGLTFRLSVRPDWDRVHTNLSQLFEQLESEAFCRNLDLRAVLALLDGYRGRTISSGEGADIHQIETEARKVQIMTMHVSKGLQFPVVFVAGGLTQRNRAEVHTFHQAAGHGTDSRVERVFDLAGRHAEAHKKEQEDEDRRLFYVALTRAQIKLYLPYYPVESAHGWVGPLSRFVAAAIQSAFESPDASSSVAWIDPEQDPPGARPVHPQTIPAKAFGLESTGLPPEDDFRSRVIALNSFSRLNASTSHFAAEESGFQPNLVLEKEPDDIWEEIRPNQGAQDAPENQLELPGGTRVGSMLHTILEQIDYTLACGDRDEILNNSRFMGVIDRNLSRFRVGAEWRKTVAGIIADALTTPISVNDRTLVLGDLAGNQRLHEVEFYFPYVWGKKQLPIDDQAAFSIDCDGYVRGYIDLIFWFEGRCYLADWKSNRLTNGYGPEALRENMDQAGYHLQYHIYSVALLRWLEQAFGSISTAVDLFGGVFYFYLRGMGSGGNHGVFYVSPGEVGTRKFLEQELARVLRRAGG